MSAIDECYSPSRTSQESGYELKTRLYGHTSTVTCLSALPDGRIVSGSMYGQLRIWGIDFTFYGGNGGILELIGHSGAVQQVCSLTRGRVVSGA